LKNTTFVIYIKIQILIVTEI